MRNFIYPTDSKRITSPFGHRGTGFHNGVDFGAMKQGVQGDNVYAVSDGIVIISKCNNGGISKGYGYYVVIEHDHHCSLYAHLQKLEVEIGQEVKKGDIIGHMGNTGDSTGPHLHFEIRKGEYTASFFNKFTNKQFKNSINPIPVLEVNNDIEDENRKLIEENIYLKKELNKLQERHEVIRTAMKVLRSI